MSVDWRIRDRISVRLWEFVAPQRLGYQKQLLWNPVRGFLEQISCRSYRWYIRQSCGWPRQRSGDGCIRQDGEGRGGGWLLLMFTIK